MAEVPGSSRQGLLAFEVEGPLESIAFDAQRGELLAPICPGVDGGACVGPIYALRFDGVSLFRDPQCPSARVQLNTFECLGRTIRYLSSCPSDGVTQPRSCIELNLVDLDGGRSGDGAYYDDAGVLFDVVIDEASGDFDLAEDDSRQDSIRSGTMRGTLTRNGGDGPSQPFELTFSACSRPTSGCLL